MKSIVITGSSKGIGYGLAQEFLKQGQRVTISAHVPAEVAEAEKSLAARFGKARVKSHVCNVSDPVQLQSLWNAAINNYGKVDIWINNAGRGYPREFFWDVPTDTINAVIRTNLLGEMFGSKVAFKGMLAQGSGQIYNMMGMGDSGPVVPKTIIYASSKAGVSYFTKGLIIEAAKTPVQVCYLSPGIVVTDLMQPGLEGEGSERARKFFNIMGDRVETVTPWLVKKMLANQKHGAYINWLPNRKLVWRVLRAPFTHRNIYVPTQSA
jgi:NAD(P)-dependent dehydrogenase (short-subunit alcohol dehydrogenase family)